MYLTSWATCGSGKPRQSKTTPGSDGSKKKDLISEEVPDTTKAETGDLKAPIDREVVVGRYDRLRVCSYLELRI